MLASIVLFLSISPLIINQFQKNILAEMLEINIPILCYLSIQLILLTVHESSPMQIVKRTQKLNKIWDYISRMNDVGNIYEIKAPELEKERDEKVPPPLHELNVELIKSIPSNNPFSVLASVFKISIENKDTETFENVISTCLDLYINADYIKKRSSPFKYVSLKTQAQSYIIDEISLMEKEIQNSNNALFLDRYISKMILFFISTNEEITQDNKIKIMASLTNLVCGSMSWSGRHPSILLLTIIRQEVTRYYESHTADVDILQQYKAISYISMLKKIGEASADNKQNDLLYRSLESLGWLGCTLARLDDIVAGKQVMLSLVQIGRKSRKNGMECHWDRCALLPIDHAFERLEWIFSWVINLETEKHKKWTSALSDAFSRIKGYKCEANITQDGNTRKMQIIETKETKYTITYSSSTTGTIDFSDINVLKEFEIM